MFCRFGSVAAQAAGLGNGQAEGGVQARVFVDLLRQRVDIGVLELGDFAVLGDQVDDRVLPAQFVELAGGRAVAGFALFDALSRQLQLFEQNLGQLARRADVEFLVGMAVDLLLVDRKSGHRFRSANLAKILGVELDAGVFHARPAPG